MGLYTWENFAEEEFFRDLVNFFQQILKKDQWDSVVFVSRKAYCLFLLLKKRGLLQGEQCAIYSDRYVMKSMNKNLFKGQKVCLVDDTLSTGQHMREVYRIVKRKAHKTAKVFPKVFVRDAGLDGCTINSDIVIEKGIMIEAMLHWYSSEVLRFSSIENLIMFQEGIPYAMELPIVSNEADGYLTLTFEEYDRLKNLSGGWEFFECNQAGYMQNNMTYGVLIMRNNSIAEFMSNLVFKFCVRLQITKMDMGYKLVAMPFAILKSAKFTELYQLFIEIYGNTSYGQEVKKYLKDGHSEEDIYILIYRAIVFSLSSYIGDTFIDILDLYVLEDGETHFSNCYQKYHFDNDFCEITENLINRTYIDYINTLLGHSDFTEIKSNENNYLNEYARKFQGLKCDDRTILLYLSILINEVRYNGVKSSLPEDISAEGVKFITLEDLQHILRITYLFEDKTHLDDLLAVCLCIMLGQSKISNEISYDSRGVIYRGFKYGTNSETLLELSAKIFYVALNRYYDISTELDGIEGNIAEESRYSKNFELFMSTLKFFISDYQLNGSVITADELKLYQEFFRERDRENLKTIIKNKTFIGEDVKQPYYLEKLKELIERSDIYNECQREG